MGRGDLDPEQIVRLEEDGPAVVLLDQRRLPEEVVDVRCTTAAEVAGAIRDMVVRGAPAIGIAAAYGLALAAVRGDDLVRQPPLVEEDDRRVVLLEANDLLGV